MLAFVDPEELMPGTTPSGLSGAWPRRHSLSCRRCSTKCTPGGRPSIPPEHLLNASLLITLYSVRSVRAFCEQPGHNVLFPWFLGIDLTDLVTYLVAATYDLVRLNNLITRPPLPNAA